MSTIDKIILPKYGVVSKCHKFLDDIGTINSYSVNSMPAERKTFLEENSPIRLKKLAKLNLYAANKIKNTLDNNFGKNGYTLISIGRSTSSIVELIKHMGVDAKSIPLSGMRKLSHHDLKLEPGGIEIYKKYLQSIGLSKEAISQNPNRKYILMDYTYYGHSLENAYNFLTSEGVLGNHSNILKIPIKSLLGSDYESKSYNHLFQFCAFKNFATVSRLPIKTIGKVFEQQNEFKWNFTQGVRKLFWFNIFNLLNK